MRIIGNILWLILGGLLVSLGYFIAGLLYLSLIHILSVSTAMRLRFVPADSANRAAASGSIANPLPEKYCAIHDGIS